MTNSRMYSHPAFSVRSNETVVTGVDDQFIKSKEGILKILQVVFGALAWIIMASLPYMQMIYTGGRTAPFHLTMTFELLAWIATLFILIAKTCGLCMNSKGFSNFMHKLTWVFIQNFILFVLFLTSACILASNATRFDLGKSAYKSYGNRGQQQMNRYGFETQSKSNNQEGTFSLGSCDSFNVNQPYCSMHAEECRKFFDDCMDLASGIGYNKYYVNAIVACVFAFITSILYLVSLVLSFVSSGWTPTLPNMSFAGDTKEDSNDIEVVGDELNKSLRKNTWNSHSKGRVSRNEITYSEAHVRPNVI